MSSHCKTIYLARHAKSAWDTDAASDFDRPLSNRGQRDVARVGQKLAELGWKPEKVISSPALRARQTCEVLCENIGISADRIIWNDDVYAAYTVSLLHLLSRQPETLESVMLVGHNPSMEELLVHLCGDVVTDGQRQNNGKLFTTGNVAKITMDAAWSKVMMHDAKLQGLLRPKELV